MITHYCIIRNQHILCDGEILFAEKDSSLNDFLLHAYTFLKIDYPKFYKMDTQSKLGFLAAEVLLQNREITKEYTPESVALVLSNAHASLDTDLRYSESAKTVASPALFVYTLSNIVAGEICIRHKIKGENAFFVSKEFDPDLLTNYVDIVLSQSSTPNTKNPVPSTQHPVPSIQYPAPSSCIAGWVNVLGGHHEVFLYLCERNRPAPLAHTAGQVKKLYNTPYGTIDG